MRKPARIMKISGVSAAGVGWVLSIFHGLFGELAGTDCQPTGWIGYDCTDTDNYAGIYVPVVGPIIEAATHDGSLSTADNALLALETIIQWGGWGTFIAGFFVGPSKEEAARSVVVRPVATPAGFGLVGTF